MKKIILILIAVFTVVIVDAQLPLAEFNRIYDLNLENNQKIADDEIKKVESKFPNDARVKFLRGMYQYKDGDENNAMKSYTEAIKADPKFDESYLQRYYIFERKGLYDKAKEDISAYIKLNPKDDQGYKQRAALNYKTENYQAALDDFKSLIVMKPSGVINYMDAANSYAKLNQVQIGKTFLDNAYAVNGIDIDVLNIIYGQFLLNQREFENAKQKYSAAYNKAENKFDADDFSNFSVCAYKTMDLNNAIVYMLKAIKLDAKNIMTQINLALYYKEKQDWNKVLEVAQQALNIDSNNPLANRLYAYGLYNTGKKDEAKTYDDKAVRLDKEQKNEK